MILYSKELVMYQFWKMIRNVERFLKWIRFQNLHSIVSFALTAKTKLNVDLLRYVHQNSYVSNIGNNLRFKFYVDNLVRISEDDINEFLHLPRDNFIDLPDNANLINFFSGIRAHHDNGDIPPMFYKNDLPEK